MTIYPYQIYKHDLTLHVNESASAAYVKATVVHKTVQYVNKISTAWFSDLTTLYFLILYQLQVQWKSKARLYLPIWSNNKRYIS